MTDDLDARSLIVDRIAGTRTDAELTGRDGAWTLTVRRVLSHGPDAVWAMLTEPARLARWSPIVPDRPLASPGPATSRERPDSPPVDVEVLHCDPPRELVHRWGGTTLRWTLRSVPDGTQLTLEHSFDDRGLAPSLAAGWHICLAVASLIDAGSDVPRIVGDVDASAHGWQALHDEYAARWANEGGPDARAGR